MDAADFQEKVNETVEDGGTIFDLVEDFVFLRKVKVVKSEFDVRIFCAETGRELVHGEKVKLDLSRGKMATAKLTLEIQVEEIVIQEKQLMFPGIDGIDGVDKVTLQTPKGSATLYDRNKKKQ